MLLRLLMGVGRGSKGMTQFFNRSEEKAKRRLLRNDLTAAESVVWSKVRSKQVHGLKFRRQYSIGPYVVDFYCPARKLAVEIDGDSHYIAGSNEYDAQRQTFIESFGIRFLRFTNREVHQNLDGVLEEISRTTLDRRDGRDMGYKSRP